MYKISKLSMKYKIHTTTNSGAAVALQNVKYSCQSKSFLCQPLSYFIQISFQNNHLFKSIQFNDFQIFFKSTNQMYRMHIYLYNIKGTDIPNEIKIFNNVHVF